MNPNSKIIKVLLIDDSPIALKILEKILITAQDIKVVGTAKNGKEGLERVIELNPDVICLDLHMPVMDGYEFTKECMTRHPKPILVVSVSVQEGSANIFKLLQAGAIDVFAKPRSGIESEYDKRGLELISKVRLLSGVVAIRRPSAEPGVRSVESKPIIPHSEIRIPHLEIIAIGASTGGPQTLEAIFMHLPANFPLPVICIQHIGDEFLDGFVEWLASICRVKVRIAQTGDSPEPGTIFFPQAGTHLKIDNNGKFSISREPPYDGHLPSISVTFKSIADYYGGHAMAILLTGMGRDGAEGMQAVSKAGGVTIAQNEATSIVFGMPKAAIELAAAKYMMSPEEIVRVLVQI